MRAGFSYYPGKPAIIGAQRYNCVSVFVPDGGLHSTARLPHHHFSGIWCDVSDVTCSSPACDNAAHARGLCTGHYKRQVAGLPVDVPLRPRRKSSEPPAPCSAEECSEPSRHRGLCSGHYQRLRSGIPLNGPLRAKRKNGEPPAECSFPDCGRPVRYKQLCKTHYECQRMGLPLLPIRDLMPRTGTCAKPDCDREIWARGLCGAHYVRDYLGTHAERAPRPRSAEGERTEKAIAECSRHDCNRPVKARDLCNAHYARQYYGVQADQPIRPRRLKSEPPVVCIVADCPKLAKGGFGWCKSHWAVLTGKSTEYSARRRSRKFDGPHDRITAADLAALLAATDDCYLCNKTLADPIEFDHVIPLAREGRHLLVNIKPTHRHCNRVKWAALPPEFVAAELGEEVMP